MHVKLDIIYCGICHSDHTFATTAFGRSIYPCVTGHEVFGKVTNVGFKVTKFQVGDLVGVGCMVDSCMNC